MESPPQLRQPGQSRRGSLPPRFNASKGWTEVRKRHGPFESRFLSSFQRASVTSTEAGFPKGDLGWRSSV